MRRPQAALAVGALLVGATVTATLLNLFGNVQRKMKQEFRSYGANVIVSPPLEARGVALMDQEASARAKGLDPRVAVAPMLYVVVRARKVSSIGGWTPWENVAAAGTDFPALEPLARGWRTQSGAWPAPGANDECLAGTRVASVLHLAVGDHLDITPESTTTQAKSSCRVAGIIAVGGSEDNQLFLPLRSLQPLAGEQGKISLLELNVPGAAGEIAREIETLQGAFTTDDVRPIRAITSTQGRVLETMRGLLISLTALILVMTALCVMATMTAIVIERRKDIATMKALGASNQLVMRLFLAEGAAMGLVGGAGGFLAGTLLASLLLERIFGARLDGTAWTLPVVCALSVALATLATFFPVKVVRGIQPAVMLKGE